MKAPFPLHKPAHFHDHGPIISSPAGQLNTDLPEPRFEHAHLPTKQDQGSTRDPHQIAMNYGRPIFARRNAGHYSSSVLRLESQGLARSSKVCRKGSEGQWSLHSQRAGSLCRRIAIYRDAANRRYDAVRVLHPRIAIEQIATNRLGLMLALIARGRGEPRAVG